MLEFIKSLFAYFSSIEKTKRLNRRNEKEIHQHDLKLSLSRIKLASENGHDSAGIGIGSTSTSKDISILTNTLTEMGYRVNPKIDSKGEIYVLDFFWDTESQTQTKSYFSHIERTKRINRRAKKRILKDDLKYTLGSIIDVAKKGLKSVSIDMTKYTTTAYISTLRKKIEKLGYSTNTRLDNSGEFYKLEIFWG